MKVLLHICCGVCAAGAIDRLKSEGHEITGYFFNPNIHPREEYERRLEATRTVCREMEIPLEEGDYLPEDWLAETVSLKDEPEGGKRCEVCFRYRMREAFLFLPESGCDVFTTTLTISPHKPAGVINEIGREIGGDSYLVRDFKKNAGFQRANIISKEYSIYRQHYCGCIYSKAD